MKCFVNSKSSIAIEVVLEKKSKAWLQKQKLATKEWIKTQLTDCKIIPGVKGSIAKVVFFSQNPEDMWQYAKVFESLPDGKYHFENLDDKQYTQAALAWALADYQFDVYKPKTRFRKQLVLPKTLDQKLIEDTVQSIYLVRDLINTAPNDLGPKELTQMCKDVAKKHKATVSVIEGKKLLAENFPAIYTVGQASTRTPRLVDMRWGSKKHPKVTLVGKGVCYDTGGLTIKPLSNMVLMKKDMAGAAHALGLAQLIMSQNLPVQLRVLIPAVENSIGGNAYRPADVITMRNGLTVEVTNTDAEGRLILADALSYACEEKPELLLDFSTLTGATKVALGADIAGLYTDSKTIMQGLYDSSLSTQDPVWPLPMHDDYFSAFDSSVADFVNSERGAFGGGILAGLFLKQFVDKDVPWAHFDFGAWQTANRPGRPQGGDAMALRAVYAFIDGMVG